MSYEKPPKQCQDAPTGFASMNTLAANQDDTKAVHDVEHLPEPEQPTFASGFGDLAGLPVDRIDSFELEELHGGQHETPKVARGTLRIEYSDLFAVGSSQTVAAFKSGVCRSFVKLGTGSYFLPIRGFSVLSADAWPLASSSHAARLVEQTPAPTESDPGIYVSTWEEHATLGLQLANFSFQVVVYGFRGDVVVTPSPAPIRPSRFARGPMWRPLTRGR